ncbi:hypothetical protein V6N13_075950 [Hibiscus sabdariffa]|uniref:Uncharacterized protein n=1 Tax=Hibiscus sabdariffa TaxID=183260 RepID=A0ABR2UD48_9ROSI
MVPQPCSLVVGEPIAIEEPSFYGNNSPQHDMMVDIPLGSDEVVSPSSSSSAQHMVQADDETDVLMQTKSSTDAVSSSNKHHMVTRSK